MRLLTVLGILAFSTTANAEKLDRTEINRALKSLKPTQVKFQGKDGVWFSEDQAEIVLGLLEDKLPSALDLIDSQDMQITALKNAVNAYKISTNSYKETATYYQQGLNDVLQAFPKLKPVQYSWYEDRTATYIYGIITAAGTIALSAWILDKAQE